MPQGGTVSPSSPNEVTPLASGQLNGADELRVELVRPADMPAAQRTLQRAAIQILWPAHPTITTPNQFDATVAIAMRVLANAVVELAAIRARKYTL
jgi:hypothetical protein